MSDYAHLDFTTWSSKAELVGDVAEVLSPQLLKQYSGTSLKRPGYVFRDGLDNSYRSFISQMMTASGGAFCGLGIGCRLTICSMLLLMSGSHAFVTFLMNRDILPSQVLLLINSQDDGVV